MVMYWSWALLLYMTIIIACVCVTVFSIWHQLHLPPGNHLIFRSQFFSLVFSSTLALTFGEEEHHLCVPRTVQNTVLKGPNLLESMPPLDSEVWCPLACLFAQVTLLCLNALSWTKGKQRQTQFQDRCYGSAMERSSDSLAPAWEISGAPTTCSI